MSAGYHSQAGGDEAVPGIVRAMVVERREGRAASARRLRDRARGSGWSACWWSTDLTLDVFVDVEVDGGGGAQGRGGLSGCGCRWVRGRSRLERGAGGRASASVGSALLLRCSPRGHANNPATRGLFEATASAYYHPIPVVVPSTTPPPPPLPLLSLPHPNCHAPPPTMSSDVAAATIAAVSVVAHTVAQRFDSPFAFLSPTQPSASSTSTSTSTSLPPSYSPSSSSSSSSHAASPAAAAVPSSGLSSPPLPPAASTATARLTDLCAADKAKVGKLLLRVAALQAEIQRQAAAELRLASIEEERSRLQAQKAEVEQRLQQSLRLLKAYQDRAREAEKQRALRHEQRRAKRKEEEHREASDSHPASATATAAAEAPLGMEAEGGGEEKEQLMVDPAHLHRLLHEQKLRIQQRMDELQRHSEPQHSPTSSPSHRNARPRSSSHTRRTSPPLSHDAEGAAVLSASASSSLSASHPPSASRSRPPPVTVSVRYSTRSGTSAAALAAPQPPTASSQPALLKTTAARARRPSRSPPPPHRSGRERAKAVDDEEEEEEDEERLLSQSTSPISRRIQRLLDIQHGSPLKHRSPPPPSRPTPTQPSHLPMPAAVRRPVPLHFPPTTQLASSTGSVSSRRSAQSATLDAEVDEAVEALNAGHAGEGEAHAVLSARLRRYDGALLETLSALE